MPTDARVGEAPLPLSHGRAYRQFAATGGRKSYGDGFFDRRVLLSARPPAGDDEAPTALADAPREICDEHTWALPAHDYHSIGSATQPETRPTETRQVSTCSPAGSSFRSVGSTV
ncbi:hypothetical protein ACVCAH_36365, partial [Micromonospora sp. LZ34]